MIPARDTLRVNTETKIAPYLPEAILVYLKSETIGACDWCVDYRGSCLSGTNPILPVSRIELGSQFRNTRGVYTKLLMDKVFRGV